MSHRTARLAAAAHAVAVLAVAALAVAALAGPAHAQSQDSVPTAVRSRLRVVDSTRIQSIHLRDGTALIGRIVAAHADTVRFRSSIGESDLAVRSIARIDEAPATALRPNGEFWFPNPNATRLLFAPTGRMLPRGTGYFSDYYIIRPGVAYSATDQVTIGGGVSLVPGASTQAFWVTPKVGLYNRERVNLAAGALVIYIPDLDDSPGSSDQGPYGIAYGVGTWGGPDASVTAGVGYAFSSRNVSGQPVAMLGAEARLSRRVAFVTENYVIPKFDEGPLVSYGLRFMGEQISLDLAFINVARDPIFPGAPFVGFVFNFR